jgi:hypothetical protein
MRFHVLAIVALLVASVGQVRAAEPDVHTLYVQGSEGESSKSPTFVPIPGMQLTLPVASGHRRFAMVTFSAPSAGGLGEACAFSIFSSYGVPNSPLGVSIQYGLDVIANFGGYGYAGLVVRVPLLDQPQTLQVKWHAVDGGTCELHYFYSLSAILAD